MYIIFIFSNKLINLTRNCSCSFIKTQYNPYFLRWKTPHFSFKVPGVFLPGILSFSIRVCVLFVSTTVLTLIFSSTCSFHLLLDLPLLLLYFMSHSNIILLPFSYQCKCPYTYTSFIHIHVFSFSSNYLY